MLCIFKCASYNKKHAADCEQGWLHVGKVELWLQLVFIFIFVSIKLLLVEGGSDKLIGGPEFRQRMREVGKEEYDDLLPPQWLLQHLPVLIVWVYLESASMRDSVFGERLWVIIEIFALTLIPHGLQLVSPMILLG